MEFEFAVAFVCNTCKETVDRKDLEEHTLKHLKANPNSFFTALPLIQTIPEPKKKTKKKKE